MSPLFAQGVQLMLVGMGTVFVFLTLLVVSTTAMSYLVQRWVPAPRPDESDGVNREHLAAITGAIRLHRRRSR